METQTDPEGPPLALSRKQAAAAIGVHPHTIDKWRKAGHLRSVTVAGKVLIPRVAIEEMLAAAEDVK